MALPTIADHTVHGSTARSNILVLIPHARQKIVAAVMEIIKIGAWNTSRICRLYVKEVIAQPCPTQAIIKPMGDGSKIKVKYPGSKASLDDDASSEFLSYSTLSILFFQPREYNTNSYLIM
jgi:hypothetical protein